MVRKSHLIFILYIIQYLLTLSSSIDWPSGLYGLPRPISGCPKDWEEGYIYQDTENEMNNNYRSQSYHLSSTIDQHGIKQEFCMKTRTEHNEDRKWPQGQYCIYKYGEYCPTGLTEGWVFWDDENTITIDYQSHNFGKFPTGTYDSDTLMYFCCSITGYKKIPISLPLDQPFFMMAYGSSECQEVEGTSVKTEVIQWDDEDRGNMNGNSWVSPFGTALDPMNTRIYFCYYDTGVCGKDGVLCQNSTIDETKEGKSAIAVENDKRSTVLNAKSTGKTQALAIGAGIAGFLVIAAAMGIVMKKFAANGGNIMGWFSPAEDVEDEDYPMPDDMY